MDINTVLEEAIKRKTSDVHITVGRPVSYRIHGNIVPMNDYILKSEDTIELGKPMYEHNPLLIKRLEELGEIDFAYQMPDGNRFRVNLFKQRGNIAIVLRLLPVSIPSAEKLGIPKVVMDLCDLKRGLVLVTGSTGSGKSTTLASIIGSINEKHEHHILTIEDPVEFVHPHKKSIVNQRELGNDTQSFANALRAALREDPDVILVGEMRDFETIQTAITAAETGHVVFSTLHTNSAATTIDRVIDVFPTDQQNQVRAQLANELQAVISQQLLPKEGGGRVAAIEVMLMNDAIRNHIRKGETFQIPSTIQTNKRAGMILMDDAIFELYLQGLISKDTAFLYSHKKDEMKKRLGGF